MSVAVKEQLLSSLSLIMEQWMTMQLPGALVFFCGANGILCAAIPDAIGAARRGYSDLPPMRNWYIDHSWTGRMILLMVPTVLAWLAGGELLAMFAGLCAAVFQLAMGTQGVCLLLHLRHKHEAGLLTCIFVLMLALMLPAVLVWAGIFDQIADFRSLRPPMDDSNDDDIY